jgi:hypothetical protein
MLYTRYLDLWSLSVCRRVYVLSHSILLSFTTPPLESVVWLWPSIVTDFLKLHYMDGMDPLV